VKIDRFSIERAARVIAPYVRRTPLVETRLDDFGLGSPQALFLKLESLQHTGSFKVRGAFNNLLTRSIPSAGVVAASGGNHGAAVAYAAHRLGIAAKIYVPSVASPTKVEQIRAFGADLVIAGHSYDSALNESLGWENEVGALRIHAFDQVETIQGQGTIAAEIQAQAPDIDTLLISVGGGGLIGGIAAWYRGGARIVGVEPESSPTLTRALQAGAPVDAECGGMAADSLAPRRVGDIVYPLAERFVDRVVLVADDEIHAAQAALWRGLRVVAEPGGAAAFTALFAGRYRPEPGERLGVVVSGGNTVAVSFDR